MGRGQGEREKRRGALSSESRSPGTTAPAPLAHVWGLTGGIASGKSTVAKLFARHGIPVVDADQVSRELSAPGGAASKQILKRFGTNDRAKLRAMVFADPSARKDLEAILHPLIRQESLRRIATLGPGPVLYEAALLVETGRYREFAGLIVVEAPWENRIERVVARDHITHEEAERILKAQLSDEERRKPATHVITNLGSLEDLEKKVVELAEKLRA